jgi:hypothetical protein
MATKSHDDDDTSGSYLTIHVASKPMAWLVRLFILLVLTFIF